MAGYLDGIELGGGCAGLLWLFDLDRNVELRNSWRTLQYIPFTSNQFLLNAHLSLVLFAVDRNRDVFQDVSSFFAQVILLNYSR